MKTELEEEQTAPVKQPFVPRVITGGKDGGAGFGDNGPDWLRDLPLGSVFLVEDTNSHNQKEDKYFALGGPFSIAYRTPNGRGVGLVMETPTGQQSIFPVNSLRFSSRYKMFDILHFGDNKTIEDAKLETEAPKGDEDDNGNSEGSVQS